MKMKYLLLIIIIIFTSIYANAQTKIYAANGNYKGKVKYVIEGTKIYYANGNLMANLRL